MRYMICFCFCFTSCASSQQEMPELSRYGLSAPHPVESPKEVQNESLDFASLKVLIQFALQNAPAIKRAKSQAALSDSDRVDAERFFRENPEVSFSAGARFESPEMGVDFEIGVEQRVEIGGQRDLRIDVAKEKNKAARSKLNEAMWMLKSKIQATFYDILLTKERKIQAEKWVSFSESLHAITAKKVESGQSPPLDLLVADADLAQSHEALIELSRLQEQKEMYLGALIGWPQKIKISGSLPQILLPQNTVNLVSEMKKSHPSIRTKEIEILWRVKAVELQARQSWVSPRIGITYTRESSPQGGVAPQILGLSLAIPLNLWNQNQAAIQLAQGEVLVAVQERELNYQVLSLSIKTARSQIEAALDILELYETKIIPKLEESFRSIKRSYELGEVELSQLTLTKQKLFDLSAKHFDARLRYYESMMQLSNLVGHDLLLLTKQP